MKTTCLEAANGLLLSVAHFPVENPVGVIQVIHGAKEHKKRYDHFAKFLQANQIAVILSDNRGHGESINSSYPLGYMDNIDEMVADQHLITSYAKGIYPDVPYYLFGHSLGSVFARCYLQKHEEEIDKLILSGMVNYVYGVGIGNILGRLITKRFGKDGYHPFLEKLSLKNQKDDRWISLNPSNLEAYRTDPLCQYHYRNQAVVTIFQAVKRLKSFMNHHSRRPDLPILSISGEYDPITGGVKGLRHSLKTLRRAGYRNVNHLTFSNMAHEVLNEEHRLFVYEEILAFLKS